LSIEFRCESENLAIIVNVFEEIFLWLLWDKFMNITQGVFLCSKAIVWWLNDLWWLWVFLIRNASSVEMSSVLLFVVALGIVINSNDVEDS